MIARGTHHVTGHNQSVIECDTPDCPEAMYVQDGPVTAAQRATDLGWHTTKRPHPQGLDEYDAHCPTHAETAPEPCTHESQHARHLGTETRCGKCGRTTHTTPTPSIRPAAALAALLARQPLPGGAS